MIQNVRHQPQKLPEVQPLGGEKVKKVVFKNEEISVAWQKSGRFYVELEVFSPQVRFTSESGQFEHSRHKKLKLSLSQGCVHLKEEREDSEELTLVQIQNIEIKRKELELLNNPDSASCLSRVTSILGDNINFTFSTQASLILTRVISEIFELSKYQISGSEVYQNDELATIPCHSSPEWKEYLKQSIGQESVKGLQFLEKYEAFPLMSQSSTLIKSVSLNLESNHMLVPLDDSALTMKFSYPKITQLKITVQSDEEDEFSQFCFVFPVFEITSANPFKQHATEFLKIEGPEEAQMNLFFKDLAFLKVPHIHVSVNDQVFLGLSSLIQKLKKIKQNFRSVQHLLTSQKQSLHASIERQRQQSFQKMLLEMSHIRLELSKEVESDTKICFEVGVKLQSLSHRNQAALREEEQEQEKKQVEEQQFEKKSRIWRSSEIKIFDMNLYIEEWKPSLAEVNLKSKDRTYVLFETTIRSTVDEMVIDQIKHLNINVIASIIEIDILASHLVLFRELFQYLATKFKSLPFDRPVQARVQPETENYFEALTTFQTERILINILSQHLEREKIPIWSAEIDQAGGQIQSHNRENVQTVIHTLVSNLAIYYFNIPLHFFQPFLEPVTISIEYGTTQKERFRALEIIVSENVLNFNLPITLYECTAAFFNQIKITIQNIKQEETPPLPPEEHKEQQLDTDRDEEDQFHQEYKFIEEGQEDPLLIEEASDMIQQLDPYYLAYASQSVQSKYARREKSAAYAIRNLTGQNLHYSLDRFALNSHISKKEEIKEEEEYLGSSLQIEIPEKQESCYIGNNEQRELNFFDQQIEQLQAISPNFMIDQESHKDMSSVYEQTLRDPSTDAGETRSPYRRDRFRKYKFLRKIVYVKVLGYDRVLEINFDSVTNECYYLNKDKTVSVICEVVKIGNQNVLAIRSPFHVSNLLNFPFNLELISQNHYDLPQPFKVRVAPQTNTILPLNSLCYDQVRIRPLHRQTFEPVADWSSDYIPLPLLANERDLFSLEPYYARCPRHKSGPLIFVLSGNMVSLKSMDQKSNKAATLKYLTIQPPLILENTFPFPIELNLSNQDRNQAPMNLMLKPLSCLWIFDIDNRFEMNISIKVKDYYFSNPVKINLDQRDGEVPESLEQQSNRHRFLQTKNLMFQMTSSYREPLLIASKVGKIQGFYKLAFFSEYWFLNQSEMQLKIKITENDFSYPAADLPFQRSDFNFELIKQLEKEVQEKPRKGNDLEKDAKEALKNSEEDITDLKKIDVLEQARRFRELHENLLSQSRYSKMNQRPWDMNKFLLKNAGISALLEQSKFEERNQQIFIKPPDDEIEDIPEVEVQEEKKYERKGLTRQDLEDFNLMVDKPIYYEEPKIAIQKQNPAPLERKSLQRVQCFSSSFIEDQASELQKKRNLEFEFQVGLSQWMNINASQNLNLGDQQIFFLEDENSRKAPCLYELILSTEYLPYPFHNTRLLTFKSKYLIQNRTYLPLKVAQFGASEKGSFKVFPLQQSPFHWCDAKQPKQIIVATDGHQYSGSFSIDRIRQFSMRLVSSHRRELMIAKVQITIENGVYVIQISDQSYKPPLRIENLTRQPIRVSQVKGNIGDTVMPYEVLGYAFPFPERPKKLKAEVLIEQSVISLGTFSLQNYRKQAIYYMNHQNFSNEIQVEIGNDPSMQVIKFSYSAGVRLRDDHHTLQNFETFKLNLLIERLGVSLLNIEMKEIAYLSIMGIELESEYAAHRNNSIHLKVQNLQIDNQLSQSVGQDAIILSKKLPHKNDWKSDSLHRKKLLQLKFQTEAIQNIDNFHSFTHFYLNLAPLELRVDGQFLEELIKYIAQIQLKVNEINVRQEYAQALSKLGTAPKGGNVELAPAKETVLFFHHFVISPIKIHFTISYESFMYSDSNFFNNSGLRLGIILFSSLKNTSLVFDSFRRHQHQATLTTFLSELKHYFIQIYFNKKHLLKIISKVFLESLRELSSSAWRNMRQTFAPSSYNDVSLMGASRGVRTFLRSLFFNMLNLGSQFFGIIDVSLEQITSTFESNLFAKFQSEDQKELIMHQVKEDLIVLCNTAASIQQKMDSENRQWLRMMFVEKHTFQKRNFKENESPALITPYIKYEEENQSFRKGSLESEYSHMQNPAHQEVKEQRRLEQTQLQQQLKWYFKKFALIWINLPKSLVKIMEYSLSTARDIVGKDMKESGVRERVRPPRFIGFNRQLEIYSSKKALAFQILHKINVSMYRSEIIESFYSLNRSAIIVTPKRIICVSDQDLERREEEHENQPLSSWDIYFKDVLLLKLQVIHPVEGVDVIQDVLRLQNDAKLMEDLIKHSAPIRLSLTTFAKYESQNQWRGTEVLSQDTDLIFDEKAIQCTIHEIKLLQKIYQQVQRRVTLESR